MGTIEAWEMLFNKYHILEQIEKNGLYEITAQEIREFYEPRLMAKYDFSKSRPELFKKNKLGLLPITNGKYVIGKFELYKKLEKVESDPEVLTLPSYIETIDPDNIYSEANALHVGYITGMLDKVVDEHLVQSISGRMRTNGFAFNINIINTNHSAEILVDKPQIEIDGGYEGQSNVVIVEAKNRSSEDFIVRQLYYPYRFWKDKIDKAIIPVFFLYDSGVYTVYKYQFVDPNNYNSLRLIEAKNYVVHYATTKNKIKTLLAKIQLVDESAGIAFPQADSFTRVIELLTKLEDNEMTYIEAAESIELVERQGKYYIDALCYLNLVKKVEGSNKHHYQLTDLGNSLLYKDVNTRNITLLKLMLEHKVFFLSMQYYFEHNEVLPDIQIIKEYILKYSTVIVRSKKKERSEDTAIRRSQTVKSWLFWALNSQV